MTEFTPEFIAKLRTFNKNILANELSIQHPFLSMHASVFLSALDEIERLQDLMLAYENDLVLLSVYGKLKRAEAEIKESNDLLRSAWMIAKRDGKDTNWEAFREQLNNALERQHKMMYKQQESEG